MRQKMKKYEDLLHKRINADGRDYLITNILTDFRPFWGPKFRLKDHNNPNCSIFLGCSLVLHRIQNGKWEIIE